MSSSWCIAGLGNPGRTYAATRHNIGFRVLDALAAQQRTGWAARKQYDYCELPALGFFLVKPMAFMNASGPALRQFMSYRNLPPARLLVVCDDLNLPLGRLRLRPSGSDGGHNGLKSIIDALQDAGFPRLRLGIGANPPGVDAADYVLDTFKRSELAEVAAMIERSLRGLEFLAGSDIPRTMNIINQNNH
jgi:PTH1 family peptidyl-tRNA hydrolase